jgi:hypothetical protein
MTASSAKSCPGTSDAIRAPVSAVAGVHNPGAW